MRSRAAKWCFVSSSISPSDPEIRREFLIDHAYKTGYSQQDCLVFRRGAKGAAVFALLSTSPSAQYWLAGFDSNIGDRRDCDEVGVGMDLPAPVKRSMRGHGLSCTLITSQSSVYPPHEQMEARVFTHTIPDGFTHNYCRTNSREMLWERASQSVLRFPPRTKQDEFIGSLCSAG